MKLVLADFEAAALKTAGVNQTWKRTTGPVVIADKEKGIFVRHVMKIGSLGNPVNDRAVFLSRGGAISPTGK